MVIEICTTNVTCDQHKWSYNLTERNESCVTGGKLRWQQQLKLSPEVNVWQVREILRQIQLLSTVQQVTADRGNCRGKDHTHTHTGSRLSHMPNHYIQSSRTTFTWL